MSYNKLRPNLKINVESTDSVTSLSTIRLLPPVLRRLTADLLSIQVKMQQTRIAYSSIYALQCRGTFTALHCTALHRTEQPLHRMSITHDCRWLDVHGTHTGLTTFALNIRITINTNIRWAVQIMQTLIMQFSPLPFYFVPLKPNIFLSTLLSNTLSLYSSTRETKFHTHTKQQTTLWFCIFQSVCFWIQTGRQKTLDRKVASIPPVPSAVILCMNGILIC
jgi:hypothetical protein